MRALLSGHAPGCVAIGLLWGGLVVGVSTQGQNTPPAGTSEASRVPASTKAAAPLRMPNGKPDLQGRWDYATVTPWERAPGTPLLINEKEARALEQKLTKEHDFDAPGKVDSPYNQAFFDYGSKLVRVKGAARASLIVDPPDGRLPPLTPGLKDRLAAKRREQDHPARAEDLQSRLRCIIGFNTGPPLTPGNYGNNVEIIQNSDYVVMVTEHNHNARIFPVDGRPHTGARQWLGDSVGHWDGNTLVVDTINFLNTTGITDPTLHGDGNGPRAHLVERFTRLDASTLLYSFTIDDPDVWTRPWTMEFTFNKNDAAPVLEYACHEGNHSVPNALSAARAEEKKHAGGGEKDR